MNADSKPLPDNPGEKACAMERVRRPARIKSNQQVPGGRHSMEWEIMLPAALVLSACLHVLGTAGFSISCVSSDTDAETAFAVPEKQICPQNDTLPAAGVTGKRRGRAALDTGAPVLEVSAAAIVRSGAKDLHEILRSLPGLALQDYGGIGGLKTVSVRGLGAAHTAVSEDGFLVRDAQRGSIDISQWDLDNTGHIRVETGTPDDIFKSASAFSSGAVLEVSSRQPDFGGKKTLASASVTGGSFHTWRPAFRIDHLIAPGWSVTATDNYLSSKGDYPYTFGSVLKVDPATGETTLGEGSLRREGSDVSTLKAGLRLDGETFRGGRVMTGTCCIRPLWAASCSAPCRWEKPPDVCLLSPRTWTLPTWMPTPRHVRSHRVLAAFRP